MKRYAKKVVSYSKSLKDHVIYAVVRDGFSMASLMIICSQNSALSFNNVYQFKISLKDSKPSIWRRIQVPENYSFWELHVAIQDTMGWFDGHLHSFNPQPSKLSNPPP
ncbi:MAG: plasmid pRiA4b ORF-3 family protein [Candidatus Cloacimonadaceae bacterium]